LWLIYDNDESVKNLKCYFKNNNVNKEKIFFLRKKNIAKHLNRIRFAHLFIDTYPCAAHTTANDSIFSGTPIVAISGNALHTRVAASLNSSIGLAELIAGSLEDYKKIIERLIENKDYYKKIIEIFNSNRYKIFDMDYYANKLDIAFSEVYSDYKRNIAFKDKFIN
jgi:predicted O-linked N-acetylglucosamine transferase (SPINDLY family)